MRDGEERSDEQKVASNSDGRHATVASLQPSLVASLLTQFSPPPPSIFFIASSSSSTLLLLSKALNFSSVLPPGPR